MEADFREFGSVVAAEEIEELILVESVLEDVFLGERPFEVTAGGPTGDVAFGDGEALFVESGDDVFVGDSVPEHAVNHVALDSGQGSDAAIAADFATGRGSVHGLGINDCGRMGNGGIVRS